MRREGRDYLPGNPLTTIGSLGGHYETYSFMCLPTQSIRFRPSLKGFVTPQCHSGGGNELGPAPLLLVIKLWRPSKPLPEHYFCLRYIVDLCNQTNRRPAFQRSCGPNVINTAKSRPAALGWPFCLLLMTVLASTPIRVGNLAGANSPAFFRDSRQTDGIDAKNKPFIRINGNLDDPAEFAIQAA